MTTSCTESHTKILLTLILREKHRLKITKKIIFILSKGWPWPANRGDHLLEVKITVIKGRKIQDFDYWLLNTGWPLNTASLNTGLTVALKYQSTNSLMEWYYGTCFPISILKWYKKKLVAHNFRFLKIKGLQHTTKMS